MYIPAHFDQPDIGTIQKLMAEYPLAAVVTLGSEGLNANHIPLELESGGEYGVLRGHVARANPMWRDFSAETGALAIFQGPQTYISPNWYPTKTETGKVVPTWNYVVVHASGPLRIIEDREWLRALVSRLTKRHESANVPPWKVSDAPSDFIENQLRGIVGIEILIARLSGKWKVSQNRTAVDRAGIARAMAALVSAGSD